MKIQLWHKRAWEFREDLYIPLQENFPNIDWIFPHEKEDTRIISEETLKGVDIFLAEVTDAATWLGIELGFARAYKKRIICMYKTDTKVAASLQYVTNEFLEYTWEQDMIEKLKNIF